MNGLLVGVIIVVSILSLALVGYVFYRVFNEFGAKEVIMTLVIVAVLIGAILFSSFITIKAGKVNCEYIQAITKLNFTTGKDDIVTPAFHRCNFDFLGAKSPSKTFNVNISIK